MAKTIYYVPVFGWLLKDAVKGAPDAKYYFVGNVFVLLAFLVYTFGYPLLIILALTGTASMLTAIVTLTATDLFAQRQRRLARARQALARQAA